MNDGAFGAGIFLLLAIVSGCGSPKDGPLQDDAVRAPSTTAEAAKPESAPAAPRESRQKDAGNPGDPLPRSDRKSAEGVPVFDCAPLTRPEKTRVEIDRTVAELNSHGSFSKSRVTTNACGPWTEVVANDGYSPWSWFLRGPDVVGFSQGSDYQGPKCQGEVPAECPK